MKAWEETWKAMPQGEIVSVEAGRVIFDGDTEERSALAAAAPDLVRALLAVDASLPECPWCGRDALSIKKHETDCVRDAALRKAGAR